MKSKKILLRNFLRKIKKNKKVKFVFLFGSHAYGKPAKDSDIDVAIYYDASKRERFKALLKLLAEFPGLDLHIFQDLPLYIRKEVLKGKLLFYRNRSFVYDIAYETIRKWEDFKKYYYDYIDFSLKEQIKRIK